MPCLAPKPGATRAGMTAHATPHVEADLRPRRVLTPARPGGITMPGRRVDAVRESAPRAAASAQV